LREPIEHLSRKIGYEFSDITIFDKALTHRSAGGVNNERMEFLGDSILGFIIADVLYAKLGRANEGDMSRLRSNLVKGETLAEIAKGINLGKYLRLGPGEYRSGGHSRTSILADGLEAVIAAVYLDGGLDSARNVITKLYQDRIENITTKNNLKDPKTRLQEHLQARHLNLPTYTVLEVTGEQHNQHFIIKCDVGDLSLQTIADGPSRRKAEQQAAEQILNELEQDA
jgi:ribonuclease-3